MVFTTIDASSKSQLRYLEAVFGSVRHLVCVFVPLAVTAIVVAGANPLLNSLQDSKTIVAAKERLESR